MQQILCLHPLYRGLDSLHFIALHEIIKPVFIAPLLYLPLQHVLRLQLSYPLVQHGLKTQAHPLHIVSSVSGRDSRLWHGLAVLVGQLLVLLGALENLEPHFLRLLPVESSLFDGHLFLECGHVLAQNHDNLRNTLQLLVE